MPRKTIPYGHQYLDARDLSAVRKVLLSDWLTQGPAVIEFERALENYCGAKHALAVSSGTAALHLACLAAGVGPGDEGITSAMTFAASANSMAYCGAKPVFADIEPDTGCIDPEKIKAAAGKKTKVVIPVHYAGMPCDMPRIRSIASSAGATVIEDAAHALGAVYISKGKKYRVGSCAHSDMTVFSFHPVKHITTGEGGAVLTNNSRLYSKLLLLRNHGITKEPALSAAKGAWYYEMRELGYNYRITDFQCAMGTSQLKKIDGFVEKRRSLAKFYDERFSGNRHFQVTPSKPRGISSYHLYPIIMKPAYARRKKEIFRALKDGGVGAQVHYIPVYMHPYYRRLGYRAGICPNAEKFYRSEISLPLYPAMTFGDAGRVAKTVLEIFSDERYG